MSGISEEAMKTPEEGPEATDSSSSYKDLISAKSNHIENLFSTSPMAPGITLSLSLSALS